MKMSKGCSAPIVIPKKKGEVHDKGEDKSMIKVGKKGFDKAPLPVKKGYRP